MKVVLEIQERIKKEFDVEFPIYSKHELDGCTWYIKKESLERVVQIRLSDDGNESEINIHRAGTFTSEDYFFGKGEHKSSKEEFELAAQQLRELLKEI